jgi:hypothetical protein
LKHTQPKRYDLTEKRRTIDRGSGQLHPCRRSQRRLEFLIELILNSLIRKPLKPLVYSVHITLDE